MLAEPESHADRTAATRTRPAWWAVVACAATLVASCSSGPGPGSGPGSGSGAPPPTQGPASAIGRFASENPGSVNAYWMPVPQGELVVDSGRNVAGGRRIVDELRRTGRSVAAIVITHPHPDHVGGLGELHQAFPQAPIYASEATAAWMRTDPLGFYPLARQADPDYPATLTYPTRTFGPEATLDLGGVRLQTAEFGPGESETATAYYEPATGTLFSGDLTGDHVTPALIEGHTCGWLVNLDRLRQRFPDARTINPGHGAPGPPAEQIDQQREYLRAFRALVRPAVGAGSPGGAEVDDTERRSITAELDRRYPGYPRVASLPNLQDVNITSVARELTAERPANLPAACQR